METEVRIESVRVAGRYRKDLGELAELADSIRNIGLLNAITLTPDLRLVAGQRRLEACRQMGWEVIPARVVDNLDSAVAELLAERDENTARKEMTITEKVALGAALEKLVEPAAADRRRAGGALGGSATGGEASSPERRSLGPGLRTIDVVGPAVGMGASTYARARAIVEATTSGDATVRQVAEESSTLMDETGNVKGPYERLRIVKAGGEVPQLPAPAEATSEAAKPTKLRKPFPDVLRDAVFKTVTAVEALHKATRDDRFTHYAQKAAPMTRSDLRRAHDLLTAVMNAMPNPDKEEHDV